MLYIGTSGGDDHKVRGTGAPGLHPFAVFRHGGRFQHRQEYGILAGSQHLPEW